MSIHERLVDALQNIAVFQGLRMAQTSSGMATIMETSWDARYTGEASVHANANIEIILDYCHCESNAPSTSSPFSQLFLVCIQASPPFWQQS